MTAVLGGGCDLGTKGWAEHTLSKTATHSTMLWDPWLEFSLAYNRGTAFSLVRDLGDARWVLGVLAIALVGALLALALRSDATTVDRVALGAIAAGAIGNGLDRVFRPAPGGGTGVVDFVKVNFPWGGSWPAFNVADALVAVGIFVFVLHALRRPKPLGPLVAQTG